MSYKWWIIVAIALFTAGIISGLLVPSGISRIVSQDIASIQELAKSLESLPRPLIALIIFLKNVFTVVFSFALSPFLCIIPITTLVVNGWLISLVSVAVIHEKSVLFLLAGILPHGILEIPAVMIAEAAALSFGVASMRAIFKQDRNLFVNRAKQNIRYLILGIILLLPAAIIETYVTPLLIG